LPPERLTESGLSYSGEYQIGQIIGKLMSIHLSGRYNLMAILYRPTINLRQQT